MESRRIRSVNGHSARDKILGGADTKPHMLPHKFRTALKVFEKGVGANL
jgi:hypothetical protein